MPPTDINGLASLITDIAELLRAVKKTINPRTPMLACDASLWFVFCF